MFISPAADGGVLDAPAVATLVQDTLAILGLVEKVSTTDAPKTSDGPLFVTTIV